MWTAACNNTNSHCYITCQQLQRSSTHLSACQRPSLTLGRVSPGRAPQTYTGQTLCGVCVVEHTLKGGSKATHSCQHTGSLCLRVFFTPSQPTPCSQPDLLSTTPSTTTPPSSAPPPPRLYTDSSILT